MPTDIICDVEGCSRGGKPLKTPFSLARHKWLRHQIKPPGMRRKKSADGRKNVAKPMMPVHAKFCWNCGVPQPTEIPLTRR